MPILLHSHNELIELFKTRSAMAWRQAKAANSKATQAAHESEARTWLSAANMIEKALIDLEAENQNNPELAIYTWREQVLMQKTQLGYTDWFVKRLNETQTQNANATGAKVP